MARNVVRKRTALEIRGSRTHHTKTTSEVEKATDAIGSCSSTKLVWTQLNRKKHKHKPQGGEILLKDNM